LTSVSYATSSDETKAILCGVNITSKDGAIDFAATDGHRLAINSLKSDLAISANLKNDGIKLLSGYDFQEPISLAVSQDGSTIVRDENTTFLIRQLDGKYPDYPLLLPPAFAYEITLDRQQILDAIAVAKLVSTESRPVKFTFSHSSLTISSEDDKADCSTQIESSFAAKEDLEICFNHKYLSAALEAVRSQTIVMHINEPLHPVIIKSAEYPDYIHLVMPVQIRT
jgi:DNA polymerase-3 subunit beta